MNALDVLKEYKDYLIILERRNGNPADIAKAHIIIDALEKRIPKKPRKNEYGFYVCPTCRADDYALMHDSNIANRYNNCNNCGQALDWGDTE